ncbi:MAG: DUF6702 family protein [Bacteroidota bacterium]
MKKKFFVVLMVLPFLAFTGAHKFYVSVTNITYSAKDDALQVTTRIFIDDLEKVLQERYGIDAGLATEWEAELAEQHIKKYLRSKFVVYLDEKPVTYEFLGREYDNDVVICYLEIAKINFSERSSITVQNEVLTDLFDEQQNIVHFKWHNKKKSFVLVRENNKGMLNL